MEHLWIAPPEAAIVIAPPWLLAEMHARLAGHRSRLGDHVLHVEAVAGLGRPWLGVVAARCDALWLDTAVGALRLEGPLARMRVAGPGYLLWAVGEKTSAGLRVTRLGVLARPDQVRAARLPPAAIDRRCPAAAP